jgi:hypothetical protein
MARFIAQSDLEKSSLLQTNRKTEKLFEKEKAARIYWTKKYEEARLARETSENSVGITKYENEKQRSVIVTLN